MASKRKTKLICFGLMGIISKETLACSILVQLSKRKIKKKIRFDFLLKNTNIFTPYLNSNGLNGSKHSGRLTDGLQKNACSNARL